MNPVVSVLVPCYRQARYLGGAVGSLIAQTFEDWEAIIVASDEESRLAARMLATDKRITIVDHPPAGVADARNAAVRVSKGRLLLPLDADDEILPTFLASTVGVIGSAKYAVAYTDTVFHGTKSGEWCPMWGQKTVLRANCLPNTSLHTFDLWRDAGGWDEAFIGFEDWAYWIACSRLDPVATHVPQKLFRHHRWDDSRSTSLDQWAPLWRAMIHTRFPDLYPASVDDRITIANGGRQLLARLRLQSERFPNNAVLQEWVRLVEGKVKP